MRHLSIVCTERRGDCVGMVHHSSRSFLDVVSYQSQNGFDTFIQSCWVVDACENGCHCASPLKSAGLWEGLCFFNRTFIERWNLTTLSDCHDIFYKLAVVLRASGE